MNLRPDIHTEVQIDSGLEVFYILSSNTHSKTSDKLLQYKPLGKHKHSIKMDK